MTTREEIQQVLLGEMKDPSLPSATFDEFNRRIHLLNEE